MKLSNINKHDVVVAKKGGAGWCNVLKTYAHKRVTITRVDSDEGSVLIQHPDVQGGNVYTSDPKHLRKPRLNELEVGDHVYFPNGGEGLSEEPLSKDVVGLVTVIDDTAYPLRVDSPAIEDGYAWVRFEDVRVTTRELTEEVQEEPEPTPEPEPVADPIEVGDIIKLRVDCTAKHGERILAGLYEVEGVNVQYADGSKWVNVKTTQGMYGQATLPVEKVDKYGEVTPKQSKQPVYVPATVNNIKVGDIVRTTKSTLNFNAGERYRVQKNDRSGIPFRLVDIHTYEYVSWTVPDCIEKEVSADTCEYIPATVDNIEVGDTVRLTEELYDIPALTECTVVKVDRVDSNQTYRVQGNNGNGHRWWARTRTVQKKVEVCSNTTSG